MDDYVLRELPGEFEFTVKRDFREQRTIGLRDRRGYTVELPHQCDAWAIVECEKDKDVAIARVQQFIKEAETALEALKALP